MTERNGFCDVCAINVKESDFYDHAVLHQKLFALEFSKTNKIQPLAPIKFNESIKL